MEWLAAILRTLGIWAVTIGVLALLHWLLAPMIRPLARLYRPPHGGRALVGTWLVCGFLLWASFPIARNVGPAGLALFILSLLAAGVATFVWRDYNRPEATLGSTGDALLPTHAGWVARVVCGGIASAALWSFVRTVHLGGFAPHEVWDAIKLVVLVLWLGSVAVTGRWGIFRPRASHAAAQAGAPRDPAAT